MTRIPCLLALIEGPHSPRLEATWLPSMPQPLGPDVLRDSVKVPAMDTRMVHQLFVNDFYWSSLGAKLASR